MVVTKTIEKVMWASVIVVKPRWPGQPIHSAIRMNSMSDEMPVMTSGMISGPVTRPENSSRPRNRRNRASAMPAMVPRIVAMVAETSAIFSERISAAQTCLLLNSETYQRVENPPQTVARREPLKE